MVSIIMPAYNAELTIRESIQSVINQTYTDWELLVIDDGSIDDTLSIIKSYLGNKKIKLIINERNLGVSKTRNRGICESTGEYIAFLDSDDIWKEEKLEIQIDYMIKNRLVFTFTSVEYIDFDSNVYPGKYIVPHVVNYKKILKTNYISLSSVVLKKEIIGAQIMEHDNVHEDYLFWIKILKRGYEAHGIQDVLLTYRIYIESKSGNKKKTLKMTYGVYRKSGLGPIRSLSYLCSHLFKSIKKYREIKRGNSR